MGIDLKKEFLIKVWEDTKHLSETTYICNSTGYIAKSTHALPGYLLSNITVENEDCIEVARKLSLIGKTCILNMASFKHPGGGVKKGSMAQEEELARRSNLMETLDMCFSTNYPLSKDDIIYTTDVTFFKDKYYNIITPFDCDVITVAALNLNNGENKTLSKPDNYDDLMLMKIKSIFYEAHKNGCINLVLSAFGCGVFKNNPIEVGNMFKDILHNFGIRHYFHKIIFAVLNDNNSVANNYEIFKRILE